MSTKHQHPSTYLYSVLTRRGKMDRGHMMLPNVTVIVSAEEKILDLPDPCGTLPLLDLTRGKWAEAIARICLGKDSEDALEEVVIENPSSTLSDWAKPLSSSVIQLIVDGNELSISSYIPMISPSELSKEAATLQCILKKVARATVMIPTNVRMCIGIATHKTTIYEDYDNGF